MNISSPRFRDVAGPRAASTLAPATARPAPPARAVALGLALASGLSLAAGCGGAPPSEDRGGPAEASGSSSRAGTAGGDASNEDGVSDEEASRRMTSAGGANPDGELGLSERPQPGPMDPEADAPRPALESVDNSRPGLSADNPLPVCGADRVPEALRESLLCPAGDQPIRDDTDEEVIARRVSRAVGERGRPEAEVYEIPCYGGPTLVYVNLTACDTAD